MSTGEEVKTVWNSLEITKLVVGLLQALAVAFLGIWANHAIQKQTLDMQRQRDEEAQKAVAAARDQANAEAQYERVLEKRKEIWDFVAPKLNQTYSYIYEVGRWKELKAVSVIRNKRDTDEVVFSFRSYLSDDFFEAYQEFMESAFSTFGPRGTDARIYTDATDRPKEDLPHLAGWPAERSQAHLAYYHLQQVAAKELALTITPPSVPKKRS